MINKYVWDTYLKSGGDKIVELFQKHLSGEYSEDYAIQIRRMVSKYCPMESALDELEWQLKRMHPYFLWNGVSSENYGIMVSEYPAVSRPKERVNQITIPGRSGVLMLPESDLPVYESLLKTAQCWVRPDADIDAICAWLQGSGSVVFGNEPERSYDARIINQIDFSKILRGRGYRSFAVPFQCQPYKRLYPPAEDITLTASGMTIHNPGTVPAWPKFTLYGSGTITLITYSGAVVLSGIGNGIILDWEAQECMSLDGGSLLNDRVDGDLQYLPPGDSVISWTGTVARIVIQPNWCFV